MALIEPGSRIQARTADDRFIERRALSAVVDGIDFPVVWLCTEEAYEAAVSEGREPAGFPWPADAVNLAEEAVPA